MISKLVLVRLEESKENGTFGVLSLRGRLFCYTLELPWRDNEQNISCIPTGFYTLVPRFTWSGVNKHGPTYEVDAVPGRSGILLHPANWDDQLLGCIAFGDTVGKLEGNLRGDGNRAARNSGKTFGRLMGILGMVEGTRLLITQLKL